MFHLRNIADHDTKYTVRRRHDSVSCASVFGREELGRDGIQNAIHDIASKSITTIPAEERIRVSSGCTREQEYSSQN